MMQRLLTFLCLWLSMAAAFVPLAPQSRALAPRAMKSARTPAPFRPSMTLAASPLVDAPLALSSSTVGDAPMAVAGVQEVLVGFVNGGGLIAIPILGAVVVAGGIGFFLYASSQPIEDDDDE
mmetsp:Transcript_8128/g.19299  ORF Transcript_8128/g.19299 Transcript_8128/m.19299 type:complete len:122 (-) Transcript_8128:147-512(-)